MQQLQQVLLCVVYEQMPTPFPRLRFDACEASRTHHPSAAPQPSVCIAFSSRTSCHLSPYCWSLQVQHELSDDVFEVLHVHLRVLLVALHLGRCGASQQTLAHHQTHQLTGHSQRIRPD